MQTQFLTVDDVVARWGGVVTRGTLANWRCKKVGPRFVKLRARVVYPIDGLIEWETANAITPESNDNARCEFNQEGKCKK